MDLLCEHLLATTLLFGSLNLGISYSSSCVFLKYERKIFISNIYLFILLGSAIDIDDSNLKFYSKETAYKKFVLNDKLDFAGASARCIRK